MRLRTEGVGSFQVQQAVTVPDTHTTRPTPLADIDGDTTACSAVRVIVAPGAISRPSGSGTKVSAVAWPAAGIPTAANTALIPPSRIPQRTPRADGRRRIFAFICRP